MKHKENGKISGKRSLDQLPQNVWNLSKCCDVRTEKTPSHFTARVEIERQISFFSFGFARVSEVRHIYVAKTSNLIN